MHFGIPAPRIAPGELAYPITRARPEAESPESALFTAPVAAQSKNDEGAPGSCFTLLMEAQ